MLVRLGKAGFTHIMKNLVLNADYLAEQLEKTGNFKILSERGGRGVPLVAFCLTEKKIYDEVIIMSYAENCCSDTFILK